MRIKKTIKYYIKGAKIAEKHELFKKENWTPLLVYIHVSRTILGFIFGVLFTIIFFRLFFS